MSGTASNRRVHWDAGEKERASAGLTQADDPSEGDRRLHRAKREGEEDRCLHAEKDLKSYLLDSLKMDRGEWKRQNSGGRLGPVWSDSSLPFDRNNNASGGFERTSSKQEDIALMDGDEDGVDANDDDENGVNENKGTVVYKEVVGALADEDSPRKERRECVPIRILNTILMTLCISAFIVGLLFTLYQEALRIDNQNRLNQTNIAPADRLS